MLLHAFTDLFHPVVTLAQGITGVTSDDTFGGLPAYVVKLFWFFMFLDVCGFIGSLSFSLWRYHSEQSVPVTAIFVAIATLCVPVLTFVFGRAVGLGPALDFFTR